METTKPVFGGAALSAFMEPFITPTAQKSALEALENKGRLNAQVNHYYRRVVEKNLYTPRLEYNPPGTNKNQSRQEKREQAERKMQRRLARIDKAFDNKINHIKKKQGVELRMQQSLGGRTPTQTFNQATVRTRTR